MSVVVSSGSEKLARIGASTGTRVAPAIGDTDVMVGAVVSVGVTGGGTVVVGGAKGLVPEPLPPPPPHPTISISEITSDRER